MGDTTLLQAERRRYARLTVPQLYVRVGGRVYHTAEWSFGGFLIEDTERLMPMGALVRIDGLAAEADYKRARKPENVDIRARVVRVLPEQGLAALTNLNLDDAAYRLMNTVRDQAAIFAD